MEILRSNPGIYFPPNQVWTPPLSIHEGLWGEVEYRPIKKPQDERMLRQVIDTQNFSEMREASKGKFKKSYLGCNLIPRDVRVEGKEEFPCLLPYTGSLPTKMYGIDERVPANSKDSGVDGFCYDYVLMQKFRNFDQAVIKARKYHCAIGWNFTSLLDGRRCEVVEAIRLNRYSTLGLQLRGVPTIQSHVLCSNKFFDFVHDGLAPIALWQ